MTNKLNANFHRLVAWVRVNIAAGKTPQPTESPKTMMRQPIIKTFYNKRQVFGWNDNKSFSRSPSKPKMLLRFFKLHGYAKYFRVLSCFKKFGKKDFLLAHTQYYVDSLFNGTGNCNSNSIPWHPDFPETVCYTNASIFNAIRYACKNPEFVTFSPTSGFHHATPNGGRGFCTFSGQVIAAIKMYKNHKMSGAFIDLDGHFGNSIEDSRNFHSSYGEQAAISDPALIKNLRLIDKAIPRGFNINPSGQNDSYLADLAVNLKKVKQAVIEGRIHYIVLCHGADSHIMDDLGGQVDTKHWVRAAEMVYETVNEIDEAMGKPVPFAMSLFGGYRTDDYDSVLSLHTASVTRALDMLCGHEINYTPNVKPKVGRRYTEEEIDNENDVIERQPVRQLPAVTRKHEIKTDGYVRCFDAFNEEIAAGDSISVTNLRYTVRVFMKDSQLHIAPVGKPVRLSDYFADDLMIQ